MTPQGVGSVVVEHGVWLKQLGVARFFHSQIYPYSNHSYISNILLHYLLKQLSSNSASFSEWWSTFLRKENEIKETVRTSDFTSLGLRFPPCGCSMDLPHTCKSLKCFQDTPRLPRFMPPNLMSCDWINVMSPCTDWLTRGKLSLREFFLRLYKALRSSNPSPHTRSTSLPPHTPTQKQNKTKTRGKQTNKKARSVYLLNFVKLHLFASHFQHTLAMLF